MVGQPPADVSLRPWPQLWLWPSLSVPCLRTVFLLCFAPLALLSTHSSLLSFGASTPSPPRFLLLSPLHNGDLSSVEWLPSSSKPSRPGSSSSHLSSSILGATDFALGASRLESPGRPRARKSMRPGAAAEPFAAGVSPSAPPSLPEITLFCGGFSTFLTAVAVWGVLFCSSLFFGGLPGGKGTFARPDPAGAEAVFSLWLSFLVLSSSSLPV